MRRPKKSWAGNENQNSAAMFILKKLYILLAVNALLFAGPYVFDRDDIRNIAARDIYDLLSKTSDLRAIGYGINGQPVMFGSAGKISDSVELYIDDIYYGSTISDLSFISVDEINRIETSRLSDSSGGLCIKIYTVSYHSEVPVSEVTYRDAFFNYRNLTANIYQKISKDYSFFLSGEIMDWKDSREPADNFRYPYQRQNFRFRLNFPRYRITRPGIETQYFTEDKYLLDSDSSHVFSSRFRTSVFFDNRTDNVYSNRIILTSELDSKEMRTTMLNAYDNFIWGDSLSQIQITPGLTAEYDKKTLVYLKPAYRLNNFINTELGGYAGYIDRKNKTLSAHIEFGKDFSQSFYFSSSHGYFYSEMNSSSSPEEFYENYISAGKKFYAGSSLHDFCAGYDFISYVNRPYGMSFDLWEPQREFLRLKYHSDISGKIQFRWDYLISVKGKIYDDLLLKNVTQADFSDSYFNDKLHINISVQHIYSEFYINSEKEIMNNLSFNLRARIVNLELFFGSDNFLKGSYEIGNKTLSVNEHYLYRTVEGFEMRRHDEIWGVRWIFYR